MENAKRQQVSGQAPTGSLLACAALAPRCLVCCCPHTFLLHVCTQVEAGAASQLLGLLTRRRGSSSTASEGGPSRRSSTTDAAAGTPPAGQGMPPAAAGAGGSGTSAGSATGAAGSATGAVMWTSLKHKMGLPDAPVGAVKERQLPAQPAKFVQARACGRAGGLGAVVVCSFRHGRRTAAASTAESAQARVAVDSVQARVRLHATHACAPTQHTDSQPAQLIATMRCHSRTAPPRRRTRAAAPAWCCSALAIWLPRAAWTRRCRRGTCTAAHTSTPST